MTTRPWLASLALLAVCGQEPPPAAAPVCDQPPAVVAPVRLIPGPPASEDFTFDSDGYLLALDSGRSLVRVARGGAPELVAPNVVANGRGLRTLPGGDVVIADQDRSLLVRLDRNGSARRLTTTISNPNGLVLGPGSRLYATDFGSSGDVYRVEPDSGDTLALARPAIGSNGIAFSPDCHTLYVGDHDTGALYRLPMLADGRTGAPERWVAGLGKPDGLAVDRCGNVYAASWDRRLYRVSPAGQVQVLQELPAIVSAVAFGSGQQGWKASSLYLTAIQEGGVLELDVDQTAAPPPPP
jgi:hypothetical protein